MEEDKKNKMEWKQTLWAHKIKFKDREVTLLKKYPAVCPHCELKIEAKPSTFMIKYFLNYGEMSCPNCNERMGMKIDEENKKMIVFDLENKNISRIGKMPNNCFKYRKGANTWREVGKSGANLTKKKKSLKYK